ncbi:MAG: hypothetical protein ACOX6L_01290 [Syntrophomonadaceae bacterium]|jgi:hypothetical protein
MRLIKHPLKNEAGAALPLVLALLVIMTLLSITAMNIAEGNTKIIGRFLGGEKAVYAAEKGYNQYLWKLNNDDEFYKDNALYDCDATSESDFYIYTPIDDSKDKVNNFRVQIRVPLIEIDSDTTEPASNRVIIRSTGWNNLDDTQLRTIEVELLRRTFTQHTMISNKEESSDGDKVIWYAGDTVYGPIHTNATFYLDNSFLTGGDNTVFWDLVTYGNGIEIIGLSLEDKQNVLNDPDIFKKGHMKLDRKVKFPGNSALNELRILAKMDNAYYNGRTCIFLKDNSYDVRYFDRGTNSWYYNGQRYRLYPREVPPFTLLNSAAIQERNKILLEWKTESSDRTLYEALDDNNNVIGQYNSFDAFKNSGLCPSLSFPDEGVIYVDGLTGYGSSPYGSLINGKFNSDMSNVFISGNFGGRLTIASANDIYITGHNPTDWRHPNYITGFNGDSPPGISYVNTDYVQTWDGDQWLSTEVEGDDMLGLIARRNVHTIHWNWPSQISHIVATVFLPEKDRFNYNWGQEPLTLSSLDYNNLITLDTAPEDITLHAAVFAVEGSFGYETNFPGLENLQSTLEGAFSGFPGLGSLVTKDQMTIFGSVGQNIREHTNKPPRFNDLDLDFDWVAGYKTEYTHDPRMLNDMPPHFISPANSGWYSNHWEEISTHVPE